MMPRMVAASGRNAVFERQLAAISGQSMCEPVRLLKADLSHSDSAISLIAATKTGHPTSKDGYGCCTFEIGHSMHIA